MINTPEKIHQDISAMISGGSSYIDSLVEYSKINEIEIETLAAIVKKSPVMKEKIKKEASELRLLKVKEDKKGIEVFFGE
jgi:hypothetical protein